MADRRVNLRETQLPLDVTQHFSCSNFCDENIVIFVYGFLLIYIIIVTPDILMFPLPQNSDQFMWTVLALGSINI